MPEYLAPGVFVEEVSFRAKSIEGVPTSTTGFVGIAPFGPVQYPGGPLTTEPRLVTSFPEFERTYGKLDLLLVGGDQRLPYLAYAARAFFLNGGQRLYVSRVFVATEGDLTLGVASVSVPVPTPTASTATWRARWPGSMGNVAVTTSITRSRDVANHNGSAPFANMAREGSIVEVVPSPGPLPAIDHPLDPDNLRIVGFNPDGTQTFTKADGTQVAPAVSDLLSIIELSVLVTVDADRSDASSRLGTDPSHLRFVGKILARDHPEDQDSVVWLDYDFDTIPGANAISLLVGLVGAAAPGTTVRLSHGNDGAMPSADDFNGQVADPDDVTEKATGLQALGEIDDIAIEAIPDAAVMDPAEQLVSAGYLIAHCEECRYRFGIIDGAQGSSVNDIREFRGNFDSTYAAIYHPWLEILDPNQSVTQGAPPQKLYIPPSGAMAGIYGRTDVERGVFKAPANEVVYGITQFESNINRGSRRGAQPGGDQRPALLPRSGQPGVGGSHPELGSRVDLHQRPPPVHLPGALDRQGHAVGRVRAQQRVALAQRGPVGQGLPGGPVAGGRAARLERRPGVLRALRPFDDDPERPGQRPVDLPHRRGPHPSGRVRHLPDRPVDGRREELMTGDLMTGDLLPGEPVTGEPVNHPSVPQRGLRRGHPA